MSEIVVFGAGGRAGRRVVAEAVARGHRVTGVVRDPAAHKDLASEAVRLVAGDVVRADDVAAAASGRAAAIQVAARLDVPSTEFFPPAARALLDGLARAGTRRLVLAGIGTVLEVAPGVALYDTPDFPADARAFSLGHTAELDVLRAASQTGGADGQAGHAIDWAVLAPPPVILDDTEPPGHYRLGDTRLLNSDPFSYADLAAALVEEAITPTIHNTLAAVAR